MLPAAEASSSEASIVNTGLDHDESSVPVVADSDSVDIAYYRDPDHAQYLDVDLLIKSSEYGLFNAVWVLIKERSVDPNTVSGGRCPLLVASSNGHTATVQLLVFAGARVDMRIPGHRHGRNALHEAVVGGFLSLIRILVENGCPINATDDDGRTALHEAARVGSYETVNLLLSMEASHSIADNDGNLPIHDASKSGSGSVFSLLVSVGSDYNAKNKQGHVPKFYCPLNSPIRKIIEDLKRLDSLVTNGLLSVFEKRIAVGLIQFNDFAAWDMSVKIVTRNDRTSSEVVSYATMQLFTACQSGEDDSLSVVTALRDGADINYQDGAELYSPLHVAVQSSNVRVCRMLINAGVDVNVADVHGNTPLLLAVSHSYFNDVSDQARTIPLTITSSLPETLDWKGGVQSFNVSKEALEHANALEEIIVLLLQGGADPCRGDGSLQTALHRSRTVSVSDILIKHGGDRLMFLRDRQGNTALHVAALNGNSFLVNYLLKVGGDPFYENWSGLTPLALVPSSCPALSAILRTVMDMLLSGSWLHIRNGSLLGLLFYAAGSLLQNKLTEPRYMNLKKDLLERCPSSVLDSDEIADNLPRGLLFRGKNDMVIIPDSHKIHLGGNSKYDRRCLCDVKFAPFTIECWIYPISLPTDYLKSIIVSKRVGTGSEFCLRLSSDGRVEALRGRPPHCDLALSPPQAIVCHAWSHVAWTCNEHSMTSIYINGGCVCSVTLKPDYVFNAEDAPIVIGGCFSERMFEGSFNGLIRDVSLWSDVRSLEMLQRTMRDGVKPILEAGMRYQNHGNGDETSMPASSLLMVLEMGEGRGKVVRDRSHRAYHGIVVGCGWVTKHGTLQTAIGRARRRGGDLEVLSPVADAGDGMGFGLDLGQLKVAEALVQSKLVYNDCDRYVVVDYLKSLNFPSSLVALVEKHKIRPRHISRLTEEHFVRMGVTSVGDMLDLLSVLSVFNKR